MTLPIPPLERRYWTMADYDQMSWHDVRIHAIATDGPTFRLLFDLDYILHCGPNADPATGGLACWVAPATLVFEPAGRGFLRSMCSTRLLSTSSAGTPGPVRMGAP